MEGDRAGDRVSDKYKKFAKLFIETSMVCSVKWGWQSREIVEGTPQVGSSFSATASASWQGKAPTYPEKTYTQREHADNPNFVAVE